ncbi:YicC family protein [Rhodoferax sp. U2-2l]|uniref:YicC/YloC family endoribonuclease n=1 Tax=Rhodoferax sp. U2-2l TaxID=2884000 RepID=UPI001D0B706A|nr:YicC/YloC family endoribonuclease [Rhodoferax sp. U2-2l]MCB8746887.1 YicC family protein [Rhodoferax sp. U2-2l]
MSVYSMTGYASAQYSPAKEASDGDGKSPASPRLGLEIRAVNSRFLDLSFRLPEELRACEPALREKLGARLKRGKVELRAAIESTTASVVTEPSTRLLQRLNAIQDNVRAWLPSAQPLSVAEVIRLAVNESPPGKEWQTEALQLADDVLNALMSAREREGARLATMLFDRIGQLRSLAAQAEPLIPQLVAQQRQRFLDRWAQAMEITDGQAKSDMAQDRALTEATAFAIRIDVAEELTRLASHLDELERLVKKGGEIGKRLDFLIQELHREANTLGSKSAALELTHISVDMKVLIEQMREQVQNIE